LHHPAALRDLRRVIGRDRQQKQIYRRRPYMYRSGFSALGSPRAGMALCLVGSLAAFCAGPVRVACAQAPAASAFEVASIKPLGPVAPPLLPEFASIPADSNPRFLYSLSGRRLAARGRTLAQLVAAAYLIPVREIVGPSWMSEARFDVEALIPASQIPERGSDKKAFDTLERTASEMFRTLLAERFALKVHHEDRRVSGYILSIGKGGPKLTESGPAMLTDNDYVDRIKRGFNGMQMDHCDMVQLTNQLARLLGAPVNDQTGLKGHYSIVIQYTYTEFANEANRPSVLQDALSDYGLRLAAGKIDAPFLVIDNVSRTPTEN
jgi:uncharacterized protein (TIGR03435 family)